MMDKELLTVIGDADLTADIDGNDASSPAPTSTTSGDERVTKNMFDSDRVGSGPCFDRSKPGREYLSCDCQFPSLPSDYNDIEQLNESDDNRSEMTRLLDELCPSSEGPDSQCECGAAECRVCCGLQVHLEDNDDPADSVFAMEEHGESEDQEHFGSLELVGMMYEPNEPDILLVCKQIREQCLQVYYGRNSFSWRFTWTDYFRSCLRFKHWANSIAAKDIKFITKITFQGRHAVEEGVEFSVDIDLLDEYPFFETSVYADEDAVIAEAIHRDMASYFWLTVQSVRMRP